MGEYTWVFIIIVAIVIAGGVAVVLSRRRKQPTLPAPEPLPAQPEPAAQIEAALMEPLPVVSAPSAALPPMAAPQFFELSGLDGKLVRFPLNKAFNTMGCAADNDIVVDELFPGYETVAERHARVELRGDLAIIEDLNPAVPDATGVFVNDRRTGKNLLRNGWRVGLGGVELVFRTAGLGTAPLNLPDNLGRPGDAERKPQRDMRPFATLPEGALIGDQYNVIEITSESPHLNVYVVENLNPVRRCSRCGFEENPIDRQMCLNCSAVLDDAMPYYPHYQVKETDEPANLAVELQLTGLTHSAALLPRGTLEETPYGHIRRTFLIGPEAPRWLVATARVPQKLTDVLAWGEQLAEGMNYLHQNNVGMGTIDGWRVALDGPYARWVDFSLCEHIPEGEHAARFASDVVGLAGVLYYLLVGQRDYSIQQVAVLPPVVGALFDRALAQKSFKTAHEFAKAIQAVSVEVHRPSSMELRVGRCSNVGRVRQLNEDSVLTLELTRIRRSISDPMGLYAMADGMGGHAAGDVASALTIDTLARKALSELWMDYLAESNSLPDVKGWLKQAVQEANQVVFGRRRASMSDMGTTIVAALICCGTNTITIAHAGDSRVYLVNKDEIRQVTTDHSLVQRLIQLGQLRPEEARTHPQRNVIYKNLGDKPRVEPDMIEVKFEPGDRLLLCSDGLTGMVTDVRIQQIVMAACSPQEACLQLVNMANAAGGEDNISVIIVEVETPA